MDVNLIKNIVNEYKTYWKGIYCGWFVCTRLVLLKLVYDKLVIPTETKDYKYRILIDKGYIGKYM